MPRVFSQLLFKVFVLCSILCGFSTFILAEPFETIIQNGGARNRIDIAILGDGYTAAEMPKYRADVQKFMQGVFAQEPYREYQGYYNVRRVDVVSNQSGADHPERNPQVFVDTALDSTYNCGGIVQSICFDRVEVYNIIFRTLQTSEFDLILVLVNDTQVGGTGGQVPVSSANPNAADIILHEFGHTFARLADEYDARGVHCNPAVEPSAPNVTKETNRSLIKWNHWIDPATSIPTIGNPSQTPGLFVGADLCQTGKYRPTFNSKMRTYYLPFEQINTEQHVKRIYNFVSPIDDISPAATSVTLNRNQSQTFSIVTPLPQTHSLNINWLVDGQQIGSGTSFTLNGETLAPGTHTIRVEINDPTPFVRNDPQQLLWDSFDWTVNLQSAVGHQLFDFDGDGRADQAVFRPSNSAWYLLRSQSGFAGAQFGVSTDKIVPADFDGDGKTDIAVFRDGAWYWLNSSNGNFNAVGFGQSGDIPIPADYIGDQRAELAVYRSGFWYILNLANNQSQAAQFGVATDKPVPADFDGDGKTDVAVYRNGSWYWLRSSDNSFRAVQFGLPSDKPIVGDYDGDGQSDPAVYRLGVWYILGSNQGFSAAQFGIASDIPAAADYDGDGKTDIAVFRDGVWYWLQSSDNQFRALHFGTADDEPAAAAFIP